MPHINNINSKTQYNITFQNNNFITSNCYNVNEQIGLSIRFDNITSRVECHNRLDPREIICKEGDIALTLAGSEGIETDITIQSSAQLTLNDYSDARLTIKPYGKVIFHSEIYHLFPNPTAFSHKFMLENTRDYDLIVPQITDLKDIANFLHEASIISNPKNLSTLTLYSLIEDPSMINLIQGFSEFNTDEYNFSSLNYQSDSTQAVDDVYCLGLN